MELFDRAKAVRLRSYHGKYLTADEDEEHVTQSRNGSASGARWEVEFLPDRPALRLRSFYGRYLAASPEPFLLGFTGKKVVQLQPSLDQPNPSLEWEALREGFQVKLKSHTGKFLRANGSLPPWRNSVTHDLPHYTATQDWVLWDVNIVEILPSSTTATTVKPKLAPPASSIKRPPSPPRPLQPEPPFTADISSPSETIEPDDSHEASFSWSTSSSISSSSPRANTVHSPPSSTSQRYPSFAAPAPVPAVAPAPTPAPAPAPALSRTIYYTVADDRGNLDDDVEWPSLTFSGTSVSELTRILKKLTMLDDIIVCTRHPLRHNLSPFYLQLPPNNRTMWLVVVDAESSFGRGFDI